MTESLVPRQSPTASSDPLTVLDDVPPSDDEERYAGAARAPNTLRGYRSDWKEWCASCTREALPPLPASPAGITRYLTYLAGHGARVGTMSRRLSAIRFAHQIQNVADPTEHARVVVVWEGIRRTHEAPPEQVEPLMPPKPFDVLARCPTKRVRKTRGRGSEPDLAGHRDRALLLVGFVAALRRSELAALTVDRVNDHPNGLVLTIPRSKTNQTGANRASCSSPRRQPRALPGATTRAVCWSSPP